jgi:hypothetical protein
MMSRRRTTSRVFGNNSSNQDDLNILRRNWLLSFSSPPPGATANESPIHGVLESSLPDGGDRRSRRQAERGFFVLIRLCQKKSLHKAPSLAGASADASQPSVSPVGETGYRTFHSELSFSDGWAHACLGHFSVMEYTP